LKAQEYRDRVEFNKQERVRKKAEREVERDRIRRLREIEKALKPTKKTSEIAPRRRTKSQKKSQQAIAAISTRNEVSEQPITTARSGRKVILLARFQE
jgi:hypothetical protein